MHFALELLKRIPRQRKISAAELHQQMTEAGWQRDLRTVQRQLDELSQNFEIDRDDRTRPYGYQWKDQAKGLSVPGLNERESLMLALAEQHLRNLLPAEVMKSMSPFFAQARTRLAPHNDGHAQTRAARDWMKKVRVVSTTQPLLPPAIKPGVFDAVSSALYANCWLEVEYQNSSNRRVTASVMPLGLAQQGPRMYLVCRFKGYDNERSLALHRVISASATTLEFERPKEFDLQKFDDDGRFGFGDGTKIRLVIRVGKAAGLHLLESPLSADQVHREVAGDYEISATVTRTEQLKWWLRGFGDELRVVSPRGLLGR
ncbi:YafY family protein [Caenimonas sp. SL110]|uniref:helix-turn-helix transcriptional regulator n=1 Tax=Caenimonas sp. SL110 TaxID=1450524 RepID=UPI001EE6EB4E|nr:WYL domain-containing protein [Caenimonas sp. SL110]